MNAESIAAAVALGAVKDVEALASPDLPARGELAPRACVFCPETADYRRLASTHVRPGDGVLELGCSFGDATRVLAKE